jgi:class 3 adenylate cyclase/tetratricopeptide (TPR) repeat protein
VNCPSCGTLNPDTSNFCGHCGRSLKLTDRPRSFVEWLQRGAPTEGERRQVTILACDTVGSSLLAEHMDPEEFLVLMNRAFQAILAPVFERGGYLARLEGDGFKAFFGAPQAHDDDPVRAVRAGLEIQAAARRVAKELDQEGLPSGFMVRVGIHTDHVVVGPVGTADAVEYTAMGIGIVLAARLESLAQPGTVLISETTHRLVEPYVQVAPLGPTGVKGRSQPVHVFEVTALRSPTELGEALGVRSPLVGRIVEIAMLREAVENLFERPPLDSSTRSLAELKVLDHANPERSSLNGENGSESAVPRGGVVHLVGETGVGKTRLLNHVRNQMMADRPQLIWLSGRALSQGQGAYGVLADLVRGYLGIGVDDGVEEMWAKLRNRMNHLFPLDSTVAGESSTEAADLSLHLANLLSLPLAGAWAQHMSDLDPETQERQIFRALRRLCERLTADGPVVLTLDDMQGADEAAVRLLKDMLHLINDRPVLFIFSFRPEPDVACWQLRDLARRAYRENNVEIVLHSLSDEAIDDLIDNLLESPRAAGVSEQVRELIQSRSGGNPLFVEEVVRSLIDRGALERSGERWQVISEVSADYIPETLHGVISARLDRLDPDTRRILQIAAVIGHTFSHRVLQAVVQNGDTLSRHLTHLQRAELVRELRRGTEQEFSFTHTLTQQVAYETLLRRQRRDHHRQVAQCIERLYANRLEEHFERLAFHYASARDWSRALDYHIKCATQAQLRFANGKAAQHYQSAWEIVNAGRAGDGATRRLLYEAQGNLDLLDGDYQRAGLRYEAALALADDVSHQARLLRKLGNVCQAAGDYEEGIQYLQRGLEMADAIGRGRELASLYIGLGQIYHRQNNYRDAVRLGSQALAIFETIGPAWRWRTIFWVLPTGRWATWTRLTPSFRKASRITPVWATCVAWPPPITTSVASLPTRDRLSGL